MISSHCTTFIVWCTAVFVAVLYYACMAVCCRWLFFLTLFSHVLFYAICKYTGFIDVWVFIHVSLLRLYLLLLYDCDWICCVFSTILLCQAILNTYVCFYFFVFLSLFVRFLVFEHLFIFIHPCLYILLLLLFIIWLPFLFLSSPSLSLSHSLALYFDLHVYLYIGVCLCIIR